MPNYLKKFCEVVRSSSAENEKAINLLYINHLYKKVVGTLREELDLYVKTLFLLSQDSADRESLLIQFFQNKQWQDARGKKLTDRAMIDYASNITGYGWETISYRFACCFIHLTILHNWESEDISTIIEPSEKKIIVDYINNYHDASLGYQSSFDDIVHYSLDIFSKIKENMECYLSDLEKC